MTSEKVFFKNTQGQRLCGIFEIPSPDSKEIIIFFHGNGSNKDSKSSSEFRIKLEQEGFNTFRFDFNGCGESDGEFIDQTLTSTTADAECALEFVKEKGFIDISIYGVSHGGFVAVMIALSHPELKRIALFAPALDMYGIRERRLGREFIENIKPGDIIDYSNEIKTKRLSYSWLQDAKKHRLTKEKWEITIPTLLVAGTIDKTVPLEEIRSIKSNFTNCTYIELEGVNHYGLDDDAMDKITGTRNAVTKVFYDWFRQQSIESI